jgi:hypothetical protein
MNSTPRSASVAWSPLQSDVAITPGDSAPFAIRARTCCAVSSSSMECSGSSSSSSWFSLPGGRTVSQRMPLSSSMSLVSMKPSCSV